MASSSSKGIGIGGIIFWIFIGYLIFGGDSDNDKKEVDIKVNNDTSVTEEIKESVSNIKDNVKIIIEEAKSAIEKEIEERKVDEEIPINEEDDKTISEEEKETIALEKKAEDELKSLEEEIKDDQELKKL